MGGCQYIALVVVLNAVIGVVQESKAEQALEALKKMATPKAIVKRNGELKEIPSEHVVPGYRYARRRTIYPMRFTPY